MRRSQSSVSPVGPDMWHQHGHGLADELRFLADWQNGLFPELGFYLRIRQIRRAGLAIPFEPPPGVRPALS